MNEKGEILRLLKMVRRRGMKNLINFLKKSDFFEAPASTKFHGNFEGGLSSHSLKVFEALYHLDAWLKTKLPLETMILCGILHDVCKIGIYHKDKSVLLDEANLFEYFRDDKFPIGHSEKSIAIIQKYIQLTDLEMILIRWHMGAYDPSLGMNSKDLEKIYPGYKLLYFADDIATSFMEGKDGRIIGKVETKNS